VDRVRDVAKSEGSQRVGELLEAIAREAAAATAQIRSLAHGIHPQVLARQGLAAAVRALVASSGQDVSLETDVRRRYARAVRERRLLPVSPRRSPMRPSTREGR